MTTDAALEQDVEQEMEVLTTAFPDAELIPIADALDIAAPLVAPACYDGSSLHTLMLLCKCVRESVYTDVFHDRDLFLRECFERWHPDLVLDPAWAELLPDIRRAFDALRVVRSSGPTQMPLVHSRHTPKLVMGIGTGHDDDDSRFERSSTSRARSLSMSEEELAYRLATVVNVGRGHANVFTAPTVGTPRTQTASVARPVFYKASAPPTDGKPPPIYTECYLAIYPEVGPVFVYTRKFMTRLTRACTQCLDPWPAEAPVPQVPACRDLCSRTPRAFAAPPPACRDVCAC
jgi:hypothetical protein